MGRPYEFKRAPYAHQRRALKFALKMKQAALFMEPRTGKTKTAIDYLSALYMAGRLERAVIVAPATVLAVWVQAFQDDCPVPYHIHIWDAEARSKVVGDKRLPTPPPKAVAAQGLNIVLVNYEAFQLDGPPTKSGMPSKKLGRFKNREMIERWLEGRPAAMILDESHKIKSPSSKSGRMIISMRGYFDYRLILTGTPITKAKRLFDVYQQYKFLHPQTFAEFANHDEFSNHYGIWQWNYAGFRELTGIRREDELTQRIYSRAFRVKREDCFDLPPRTTNIIPITLSTKTGRAYDELAKEMVAEIEHGDRKHLIEASIPLVLALRLSQITGGFGTTSRSADTSAAHVIPLGTEKLSALEGIVDEAIENEEKLVVAARFQPEMDAIAKMVARKKIPCYQVRGGRKRDDITRDIEAFQTLDGAAVMVLQPQAGGVGIDLSSAAHMVWFSLTTSWVDYTQACDRIALSKKATTYTYLLAQGTVDELLLQTLQTDGDVSELILKDPRKVLRP